MRAIKLDKRIRLQDQGANPCRKLKLQNNNTIKTNKNVYMRATRAPALTSHSHTVTRTLKYARVEG